MENLIISTLAARKKTITVLFFIINGLVISNCFPQQNIQWQNVFDGHNGGNQEGYDICQTSNGHLYAVSTDLGQLPQKILTLKINQFGDTVWKKTISGFNNRPLSGYSIISTFDNGCLITGSYDSSFVIKLDSMGNIIWRCNYGNIPVNSVDIIQNNGGGYVICGRIDGTKGYVLKVNSNGNLIWQKTFSSGYSRFYESINIAIDNGYILTGYSLDTFTDTTKLLITKINEDGELVWEKKIKINNRFGEGKKVFKKNNLYYVAGITSDSNKFKIFLCKLSIAGDINSISILNSTISNRLTDASILDSNRILISTEIMNNSLPLYPQLFVTDTNFNIIRDIVLNPPYYSILRTINIIDKNNSLLIGEGDFGLFFDDVYIIRIDSSLNLPVFISITNNQTNISNDFHLNQNFPNPFNASTIITYKLNKPAYVNVQILDLLGNLVSNIYFGKQSIGEYKFKFQKEYLSSGIYFYSLLINSNRAFTRKMILIK